MMNAIKPKCLWCGENDPIEGWTICKECYNEKKPFLDKLDRQRQERLEKELMELGEKRRRDD